MRRNGMRRNDEAPTAVMLGNINEQIIAAGGEVFLAGVGKVVAVRIEVEFYNGTRLSFDRDLKFEEVDE